MERLIGKVEDWAKIRNLHTADPKGQALKVLEEFTEMVLAYKRDDLDEVIDGVGDTYVTVIILSHQLGLDVQEIIRNKELTLEEFENNGLTISNIKEATIEKEDFFIDLISNFTTALSKSDERGVLDTLMDVLIVSELVADEYEVTVEHCLQTAYDEIKDRKGILKDGVFVKYDDLTDEEKALFD